MGLLKKQIEGGLTSVNFGKINKMCSLSFILKKISFLWLLSDISRLGDKV